MQLDISSKIKNSIPDTFIGDLDYHTTISNRFDQMFGNQQALETFPLNPIQNQPGPGGQTNLFESNGAFEQNKTQAPNTASAPSQPGLNFNNFNNNLFGNNQTKQENR